MKERNQSLLWGVEDRDGVDEVVLGVSGIGALEFGQGGESEKEGWTWVPVGTEEGYRGGCGVGLGTENGWTTGVGECRGYQARGLYRSSPTSLVQ